MNNKISIYNKKKLRTQSVNNHTFTRIPNLVVPFTNPYIDTNRHIQPFKKIVTWKIKKKLSSNLWKYYYTHVKESFSISPFVPLSFFVCIMLLMFFLRNRLHLQEKKILKKHHFSSRHFVVWIIKLGFNKY